MFVIKTSGESEPKNFKTRIYRDAGPDANEMCVRFVSRQTSYRRNVVYRLLQCPSVFLQILSCRPFRISVRMLSESL